MSVQNHPFCRDVSRDEAIRAAEDAAAAERTPLPDHRDLPSAINDLRRRVEQLEACACAGLMQGLGDDPQPAKNHDAPPGARVSDRQCEGPADTGADTAGSGLRTERVTLEVTHDCAYPAACGRSG